MAKDLFSTRVLGVSEVSKSLRSLADPVEIRKMDKKAAEIFADAVRDEAPVRTGALRDSVRVVQKGDGYYARLGDSNTTYVRPVLAHESSVRGKNFLHRAFDNTRESRLSFYRRAMSALITRNRLRR